MGVIVGEWLIDKNHALEIIDIVKGLESKTGLTVNYTVSSEKTGELLVPLLHERLFGWEIGPDKISMYSVMPENPYVWTHLHDFFKEQGGRISDNPIAWRPAKDAASLQRPWSQLSKLEQFVLRHGLLGPWRPFDGILYSSR